MGGIIHIGGGFEMKFIDNFTELLESDEKHQVIRIIALIIALVIVVFMVAILFLIYYVIQAGDIPFI